MAFVEVPETDALTSIIIGAAIEVHRGLGPGLLESVYVTCLARELELQGVGFQRERLLPLHYKGRVLNVDFKVDLLVDARVIVEVKSIEHFAPVHRVSCSHTSS